MFDKLSIKQIFLADAAGALLTALLTGFVLTMFVDFFGMPMPQLRILSGIAFSLCLYSLLSHFFAGAYAKQLMQVVALLNLLYCCITIAMVIITPSVTIWGWLYFAGEALIIIVLAYTEWSRAKRIQ